MVKWPCLAKTRDKWYTEKIMKTRIIKNFSDIKGNSIRMKHKIVFSRKYSSK